ncbi:uncharacterized protein LOC143222156 isoform X6 [Tachypleus tridentatus]|uniref:uncharacterized protein LOC143222156 isoform X6 n=1 Tax=Tachypleus tridentatus TaxID=6853 RepID=UPI003FD65A3F
MSSSSGIMCFVLLCVNFGRDAWGTRTAFPYSFVFIDFYTLQDAGVCLLPMSSSMATKQFSITRVSVSWKPAKQMRRKKQVVPNLHNFL